MKLKQEELIDMVEYFGYKRQKTEGKHILYKKGKSIIMLASLRSNQIIREIVISGISTQIMWSGSTSQKKVENYMKALEFMEIGDTIKPIISQIKMRRKDRNAKN